ncbi:MAG: TRZ/ATZ family hydrolase [Gammaproteobacteria bacterium]|nr:MAG: TRZ/ATZ family hydrolase [Gammaproteobacteria bacterium]
MQQIDLIVHARWVIPVEPAGVLEHHCVAVHEGRIAAVLPSTDASMRYRAADILHLPDHALIPGLINAHTHAAMSLLRGLADDLPLMEWLNKHIWPAESAWVNPEFVHDGAGLAVAEMLRGGVTCFNDMYFFPDVTARVAARCGMRANVGLIVLDFSTAWASNADDYLHKGIALHDLLRNEPLLSVSFAPHAPYTVSDAPLQDIVKYAEEMNLQIHMHVHETAEEVRQGVDKYGTRPLQRLQELGLLSPSLMAVHMTQLTDEEIAQVARSGAHVLHCPESNLKLASGFCPVDKLIKAGVNVAIGTDGAASNNDLDMWSEMRSAALLAKGVSGDATSVPAAEALRMATINGARALGLEDKTGSLQPGKAADMTAVHLGAIETQPLYDPVSQLVYAAGRHQVTDVWVAGRRLLRERKLTTLDEQAILARAAQWRDKIRP